VACLRGQSNPLLPGAGRKIGLLLCEQGDRHGLTKAELYSCGLEEYTVLILVGKMNERHLRYIQLINLPLSTAFPYSDKEEITMATYRFLRYAMCLSRAWKINGNMPKRPLNPRPIHISTEGDLHGLQRVDFSPVKLFCAVLLRVRPRWWP
jgi:hypothetical protein